MEATYSLGDAVLVKKAFNHYHTEDVVYFEFPVPDSSNTKTYLVQRIYGLPGDSIQLQDKQVFLNGFGLHPPQSIKHNYFVKTHKVKLDSLFKLRYHITEGGEISDQFDYSFSLTKEEVEALKQDSLIKSVELKKEKVNNFDQLCFPGSKCYAWNLDQYGKMYLPKKNDTLQLDTINLAMYSVLIKEYEKNNLEVKHDSIFINGTLTTTYLVKKNYYFVLADNRDNANDSRVWGFLPEDKIKGKVIAILKHAK